jgi:hypothetical protein
MSAGVKLIFNMFDNHFTEYHTDMMACAEYYMEDSFKYLTEDVLNGKCRRESGLRKLLLKGAQFFPTIVSTITNKAHFWVYFYGSKEATKNYNCIIKLYGGPDTVTMKSLVTMVLRDPLKNQKRKSSMDNMV